MSDVPRPLDLEAVESEMARANQGVRCPAEQFIERRGSALLAEVKRLREALDGLVKINAEDFPAGPDGRIDWNAFPVTFSYAKAYRAALVALGREAA